MTSERLGGRPAGTRPDAGWSRLTPTDDFDGCPAFVLDVPETIPQLGYGSHQFFRYYGKFPSVVGAEIVRRFAAAGAGSVLDCYAGSGTTLVEAQIAGIPSFGIDTNPLAVLACRVKTGYHDAAELRAVAAEVGHRARASATVWRPSIPTPRLEKWFAPDALRDLGRLRAALDEVRPGPARDFLTVALLGIVRRCSNAYDGEVRPHVNPAKRPRPPLVAFDDKVDDMLAGLAEVDEMRPTGVPSHSVIGDSREPSAYPSTGDNPTQLVVAHPPYLNSFNYFQVFSLELMWATELEQVWQGWTPDDIRAAEHRAWPATSAAVKRRYYEDLWSVAKNAVASLADGGVLAVVVGDATIRRVLEPVHRTIWDHLADSGLEAVEIWFRTTHYGMGKYAYRHRADYHGAAEKRDAVMFFRRGRSSGGP
jgi:hypothetical protein